MVRSESAKRAVNGSVISRLAHAATSSFRMTTVGSMVGRYVRPASRNRASILSRPTVELGRLRAGFDAAYSNADRPGAVHLSWCATQSLARSPISGGGPTLESWAFPIESDHLLDDLWWHVDPTTRLPHAWEAGDLVIWDNRFTLHRRGTLGPQQRRLMYHAQVGDTEPPMAA